jgi:hypothetical protein
MRGDSMFDIKIEGLDALQREMNELADAARALDGNVCDLRFDPSSEQSVRDAITRMEAAVDAKIARWRSNPSVRAIAENSKEHFRRRILRMATEGKPVSK